MAPRTLLVLTALLLFIGTAGAEPLTSIPNPRARDASSVTDMSGILRADSKDNGLLFLWSTGDRRVRVEVGYGFEGVLPDGKTGAILDAYVIPKFKSGEFDAGVLAGVGAVLSAARNEPVELSAAATESNDTEPSGIATWLMSLVGAMPVALGSLFGFRKWRRNRRRRCPSCQSLMTCLAETEDDALLEGGQQAEERIGSVDYDVWNCPTCSHHFTLRYPKWVSKFEKCPRRREQRILGVDLLPILGDTFNLTPLDLPALDVLNACIEDVTRGGIHCLEPVFPDKDIQGEMGFARLAKMED